MVLSTSADVRRAFLDGEGGTTRRQTRKSICTWRLDQKEVYFMDEAFRRCLEPQLCEVWYRPLLDEAL